MNDNPRLVATTGSTYNCSIEHSLRDVCGIRHNNSEENRTTTPGQENNYFKASQWTADGTTVISESADNCIRTFIIPPDVLDKRPAPITLAPYSTIVSFEPVHATAISSSFNYQDVSSTYLLCSVSDHPIRLHSALAPDLLASFPLINPETEAFIAPHSLAFLPDGRSFITGSQSLLCIFDLSQVGSGPLTWLPTIPSKRKKIVSGGVGMKGIVSAIGIEPSSQMLAAGTFTRNVGLYDSHGKGDCVGVFSLRGSAADSTIGGSGVTQLLWSPCGRYLYVVERKSGGIMTYDIRKTGQLLGWLEGRRAETNQRLRVDISSPSETDGHALWAGGVNGAVAVWKSPHLQEGGCPASWEWKAHDDSVTSATVHKTGSIIATCSGQRRLNLENDLLEDNSTTIAEEPRDNTLRLWAL